MTTVGKFSPLQTSSVNTWSVLELIVGWDYVPVERPLLSINSSFPERHLTVKFSFIFQSKISPGLSMAYLTSWTDLPEEDPCLLHSRKGAWGVKIRARQCSPTYLWLINKVYIIIIIKDDLKKACMWCTCLVKKKQSRLAYFLSESLEKGSTCTPCLRN